LDFLLIVAWFPPAAATGPCRRSSGQHDLFGIGTITSHRDFDITPGKGKLSKGICRGVTYDRWITPLAPKMKEDPLLAKNSKN
jgi:hypothetical protein